MTGNKHFGLNKPDSKWSVCKYRIIQTLRNLKAFTYSGPSKCGLHSIAVSDAKPPHYDATGAFFAFLHLKFTTPERKLEIT